MIQVLVVEDNPKLCEIIQFYLTQDNQYQCTLVNSAEEAVRLVNIRKFDIILLDILLPKMNGIEFCENVRKSIYCPIIFISCLNDEDTIIKAIQMGGDDYIVKPFSANLLMAHMEANLRRCKRYDDKVDILKEKDLELNFDNQSAYKNGNKLFLSPTEFELLAILMQNKGVILPFEDLYTRIWQQPSLSDIRTLFVHVSNLRKKIEDDPANPVYIHTHQRRGYMFSVK